MGGPTRAEKYAMIEAALLANPHFADRRIAFNLPVHMETVNKIRRRLVAANKIPKQEQLLGIDDKWRPAPVSHEGMVKGYDPHADEKGESFSIPQATGKTFEAEIVDVLLELVKYALPYRSDLVERLRKLRG